MEKLFSLKKNGTDVKTEIIAGVTTFMTMAYILSLNPTFLSAAGMEWERVFTATALSSAIACMIMGLYARLPFALAPGVGLGAFFAYTVCLGMGYSWRFALTAIFVEGIIFIRGSSGCADRYGDWRYSDPQKGQGRTPDQHGYCNSDRHSSRCNKLRRRELSSVCSVFLRFCLR